MIFRQALFEGRIRQGREAEFRAYVASKLMPLWRRFPGIRDLHVLYEIERDSGMPEIAMMLSMSFETPQALQTTLESNIRRESREVTKGLLAMFDGRVRHHVFDLAHTEAIDG